MSATAPEAIVVLCTVPSDFDPLPLALDLVNRSLAACVQLGPELTSIYKWNEGVEKSAERLLIIKSTRQRFAQIEGAIRVLHPYEVPEIVALAVTDGSAPYLAWVAGHTGA